MTPLRTSSLRLRLRLWVVFIAVLAWALAAPAPAPAQSRCGLGLLEGLPDRLRALEAQHPVTSDDAVRRARDIAAVVADPAISASVTQACPGDDSAAVVRTVAHQRLLVLWAKMLALEAVDLPVYPAPYDRRCSALDGATWQSAFIRAYVDRLDPQGTDASQTAVRQALADDPLAQHVNEMVAARAQRLRIGALPGPNADEAAWLQNNELARSKAQAALTNGVRCGPIAGVTP